MADAEASPPKKKGLRADEKRWAAFTSVLAAMALTSAKLIVGIWTRSLGILSEALHSGLDLVAAAMTLYAVSAATRPPDAEHQFGHGRIESFSALVETLLLLLTVGWIIYEATRRILLAELAVDTNIIAFGVVVAAIVIDYTRSRNLSRAAKKYDSQALAADALHFRTDILSSSVVFVGLLANLLGFPLGDPLGAIGVALVVLVMTARLGRETVQSLLDRAPSGLSQAVWSSLHDVEGIKGCGRIRIRKGGPITFVDAQVYVDQTLPLDEAYQIGQRVRAVIERIVGRADVVISTVPTNPTDTGLLESIRRDCRNLDWIKEIRHVHAFEFGEQIWITLTLGVAGAQSLRQSHDLTMQLENYIRKTYPSVSDVTTHLEPVAQERPSAFRPSQAKRRIQEIVRTTKLLHHCQEVRFFPLGAGTYAATLNCEANPTLSAREIHKATTQLETRIREQLPLLSQIVIEVKPSRTERSGGLPSRTKTGSRAPEASRRAHARKTA